MHFNKNNKICIKVIWNFNWLIINSKSHSLHQAVFLRSLQSLSQSNLLRNLKIYYCLQLVVQNWKDTVPTFCSVPLC